MARLAPTFAMPQPMAPTFAMPQPMAPQAILVPMVMGPQGPQAPTPPTPPTTPDSGTDCNRALQRVTAQMETLTKVVEKHTIIMTSHERRIQAMEDWLQNPDNLKK